MSVGFKACIPLLVVESVDASLTFYRDELGFEVEHTYGEPLCFATIKRGDTKLMLDTPEKYSGSEPRRALSSYGNTVLFIDVTDVDALHAELKERGLPVGPLADQFYGVREFYLRDPDGYELGFGMRLGPEPK